VKSFITVSEESCGIGGVVLQSEALSNPNIRRPVADMLQQSRASEKRATTWKEDEIICAFALMGLDTSTFLGIGGKTGNATA
jgi:hypothetical protein